MVTCLLLVDEPECWDCHGAGELSDRDGRDWDCPTCDGWGFLRSKAAEEGRTAMSTSDLTDRLQALHDKLPFAWTPLEPLGLDEAQTALVEAVAELGRLAGDLRSAGDREYSLDEELSRRNYRVGELEGHVYDLERKLEWVRHELDVERTRCRELESQCQRAESQLGRSRDYSW